jgi:hypothetical protein
MFAIFFRSKFFSAQKSQNLSLLYQFLCSPFPWRSILLLFEADIMFIVQKNSNVLADIENPKKTINWKIKFWYTKMSVLIIDDRKWKFEVVSI